MPESTPTDQNSAPGVYTVRDSIDIYGAAALRDAMLSRGREQSLIVDLQAVSGCDVTGLQILCAARAAAEFDGRSFVVTNPSQTVSDACAALGFDFAQLSKS